MATERRFNAPPLLLAEAIDDSQTTLSLIRGADYYRPFPSGDFFYLKLKDGEDVETVKVTKYEGGTFTIERGDDPVAFPAGILVENVDPASGSSGPKVYRAILSQSGTDAPTAIVLENTLGGTVVWTRVDVGVYLGTLAGAFVEGKTTPHASVDVIDDALKIIRGSRYPAGLGDSYSLITTDIIDPGAPVDGCLDNRYIEILVYP